ncbi:MAG: DUF1343 domain-containing protein, partial [Saprospiraceae bacterium]|nr:DUF1343 domain-containing protein [Saprospiraceae bacterium]
GISVVKVFGPEHGWKGTADDGALVKDAVDTTRQIEIISLYGKNKKPTKAQLEGLDILVFDIQDVGTRFYTYISTLQYIMEAAAASGLPVLVLDRPNPNGHYVDGPTLDTAYRSFVGLQPIPAVYGMTIGEYAQMLNGEGWLEGGVKCDLKVIPCIHYDHTTLYELPVGPSPNLPNMRSVYLYPSLVFFEGTVISEGRGTDLPFQCFGHPDLPFYSFAFTPTPGLGAAHPKLEGQTCLGKSFGEIPADSIRQWRQIRIEYLVEAFENFQGEKATFFLKTNYIDKLSGSDQLRKMVLEGKSAHEIRATWQEDINAFLPIRAKYLLYKDF